ncbi:MAG: tRNA (adenosine(37)-N6)-threonylcarbamoyltransferase complex ATPase subunit type 1 TsaE [Turicibacter sp.]|jgi:tRNA threonylcarbamoyladenosine biosynthesis protein TsaE|uniref:tRNA threonylcarbamoyladenosine biosynthesis protein TsaE n=1 Tax=Turicibacter faecis TaxID=2963365 RepID=A0ABN6Z8G2_9FIRM|nr:MULTISPECIES: tRNA (adenosine(37)-N6)-threonylcarbamoyltransferase complex ATPase subunit type 1 TsaE [unclassified Turicibacter]MCI8701984.1 tRNA (adenosine(37)-N6)-threonylcarbamoyltransferase complex ATPase subunit type 1 TsaE [Turicibacter sp.]BEH90098.1 tRNA (adenosine(37)-N6)-threonylcarbamoyltransferase complex ATPase subunit type 1 TsaE [Turicibacter sp. TC023]MCU7204661.1 tRNA (adenosine(37)-N6)-threonylcarbamoyltransferase complex ATPase subunit type 1 TsaE [Turicibacter sp. TA25]M
MTYKIRTTSLEQTQDIAYKIGKWVSNGMILTLEGDLGAGKTTFTKGLAKGLGINRNVNSPTFNIIKEYQGRIPLYHMDVYRLESGGDDIGLDDYLFGDGVCVIEWASRIEDLLPMERLDIKIFREGENQRCIELTPIGKNYETIGKVL